MPEQQRVAAAREHPLKLTQLTLALSTRTGEATAPAATSFRDTEIASTDALLVLAAGVIDSEPAGDHELLVGTCRSAAEKTARAVIDVVPRLVGPGPLCWDRRLAQHLADLQVYVRQHHGELIAPEARGCVDRAAAVSQCHTQALNSPAARKVAELVIDFFQTVEIEQ